MNVYDLYFKLEIIDMNDENQENQIKLYFDEGVRPYYCIFNLKDEFILYGEVDDDFVSFDRKTIWIYSTQTKNNKWVCKRIYKISEEFELISISKCDRLYLFSNHYYDYYYEWNVLTEKSTRIPANEKKKNEV